MASLDNLVRPIIELNENAANWNLIIIESFLSLFQSLPHEKIYGIFIKFLHVFCTLIHNLRYENLFNLYKFIKILKEIVMGGGCLSPKPRIG